MDWEEPWSGHGTDLILCASGFVLSVLQGGLIASHVAVRKQELFQGLVLAAPALLFQSGAISTGPFTVSIDV